MNKYYLFSLLLASSLLFPGCVSPAKKIEVEMQAKNAALAQKTRIDNDIYRPYEELNTEKGYREFVQKYPDNVNLDKALLYIEKVDYDACTDAACLTAFINQYPESVKVAEATERLRIFALKDLAAELKNKYDFDLLLYRLNVKSLKKELMDSGKANLAEFRESFSQEERAGKIFFCTSLTFTDSISPTEDFSPKLIEDIFDSILSSQLDYLSVKFKKIKELGGFSFEIIPPPSYISTVTVLKFYFDAEQIDQYIHDRLSKEALLKASLQLIQKPTVVRKGATSENVPAALPRTAEKMREAASWIREADIVLPLIAWGLDSDNKANNGRFRRSAVPAFALSYPAEWSIRQTPERISLCAKTASLLPAVDILIAKISGDETEFLEFLVRGYAQTLKKKGSGIDLLYNIPTDAYAGHRAYEYEIRYKLPPGDGPARTRTVYGNVIAQEGYAIILAGETEGEIDALKNMFESLELKKRAARKK